MSGGSALFRLGGEHFGADQKEGQLVLCLHIRLSDEVKEVKEVKQNFHLRITAKGHSDLFYVGIRFHCLIFGERD